MTLLNLNLQIHYVYVFHKLHLLLLFFREMSSQKTIL